MKLISKSYLPMKKYSLLSHSLFFILLFLLFGCQNNDNDINDEEFIITDASFQNYPEYYYSEEGLIPANSYKIAINLGTNNSYASRFGINPVQQNKIVGISIITLLDLKNFAKKGDNINDLFLVQKNRYGRELYQTIETFLKEEEGKFESLDSGKLVFTNQDKIIGDAIPIIQKNDTIPVQLYVKLTFDNKLEISDTLFVTLFSN